MSERVYILIQGEYRAGAAFEQAVRDAERLGIKLRQAKTIMPEGKTIATFQLQARGQENIEQAVQSLESFGVKVQQVKYQTESFDRTMDNFFRAFSGLSTIATQISIMGFVWAITFRGAEHAQLRLIEAQEKYNEVVEKYGAGSREAIRQYRRLQQAQRDLQWAQMQTTIQTAILIPQLAYMGATALRSARQFGSFIKQVFAGSSIMEAFKTATVGATTAEAARVAVKTADVAVTSASAAATEMDTFATLKATAAHWAEVAALKAKAAALALVNMLKGPVGWVVLAGAATMLGYYAYQASLATRETEKLKTSFERLKEAPAPMVVPQSFTVPRAPGGLTINVAVTAEGVEPNLDEAFEKAKVKAKRELGRLLG